MKKRYMSPAIEVERLLQADIVCASGYDELEEKPGHLHNHVGLTENFDQSENEEFLVNDSP